MKVVLLKNYVLICKKNMITSIRNHFPICNKYYFFQSAGLSPIPEFILKKYISNYENYCYEGDFKWQQDVNLLKATYEEIAKWINTSAENISFVENNSLAMSLIALSLKKKHNNFNIVSLAEEFPSNSVPFEYLGIEMKYVQHNNHRYTVDSILNACDDKTLAVVVSYVQYSTGFRLNIEKLGNELKKRNILFIVNATQAFPFFSIDFASMQIDVLTCSLHKWTFCAHIGTLFVTSDNYRKNYPSPIAGWLSLNVSEYENFIHTQKNVPFKLWENAQQYNFGSSNIKNRILIKDVLLFLKENNLENLRKQVLKNRKLLINLLKEINVKIISPNDNDDEISFIVSIDLGKDINAKLLSYLEKHNVIVTLRNNFIRISLNIFNNEDDVKYLISCIKNFLDNK
jgi:selenocysteine lyase/cysteine desulfurase